ncbi:hypothetical protein BKI52_02710 [marine bacterium AO1-C]|nr:hypothetical protein BKI52_02710 [marine bacterium AO1-C]
MKRRNIIQQLTQQAGQLVADFNGKSVQVDLEENSPHQYISPTNMGEHGMVTVGDNYPSYTPMANMNGNGAVTSRATQQSPIMQALDEIPHTQQTYTVIVKNDGAAPVDVALFGGYAEPTIPNDVTIELAEKKGGYPRLVRETITKPFTLKNLKLIASNDAQFANPLTLFSDQSTGRTVSETIHPVNYRTSGQFQSSILDIPIQYKIDSDAQIIFSLNAGVELTFVFSVSTRVDLSNILKAKPALTASKS